MIPKKLIITGFWLILIDWSINKGLDLGHSPFNHAKFSFCSYLYLLSPCPYLYFHDKMVYNSGHIQKNFLSSVLMLLMTSQLSKLITYENLNIPKTEYEFSN